MHFPKKEKMDNGPKGIRGSLSAVACIGYALHQKGRVCRCQETLDEWVGWWVLLVMDVVGEVWVWRSELDLGHACKAVDTGRYNLYALKVTRTKSGTCKVLFDDSQKWDRIDIVAENGLLCLKKRKFRV